MVTKLFLALRVHNEASESGQTLQVRSFGSSSLPEYQNTSRIPGISTECQQIPGFQAATWYYWYFWYPVFLGFSVTWYPLGFSRYCAKTWQQASVGVPQLLCCYFGRYSFRYLLVRCVVFQRRNWLRYSDEYCSA
jgi:hypothetical protein